MSTYASSPQPSSDGVPYPAWSSPARPLRRHAARAGRQLLPWVSPLVVLAVWVGVLEAGLVAPYQLPYPSAVLHTIADLAQSGELTGHVVTTLRRVALGFALGSVAGVGVGAVVGLVPTAARILDPTLQALRSIPSLAWVPLFLLWFGIGEVSKVALIALGAFFPVYLNLVDGVRGVDRKLVEVGRMYGLGRLAVARRIALPATLPALLTGLRGGLGLAWMFVVAAELIAASEGLGYLMSEGRVMARPDVVVAAIVLFAVFGKLTDWLVEGVQRRALRWQDTATA